MCARAYVRASVCGDKEDVEQICRSKGGRQRTESSGLKTPKGLGEMTEAQKVPEETVSNILYKC